MLVILDWDGTVCNSQSRIVSCMQRAADRTGLSVPSAEAVENIIGLGLPEAASVLFPVATAAQRRQLRDLYSQEWLAARGEPLPLFDGVRATLSRLLGAGHRLAVATGKSRRGLNREFEEHGIGGIFTASRCADETASKPDPRMLKELLQETGCPVGEAVMVGDTVYDLEMAASMEMAAVGVSYGAHHPDKLKECQPNAVIDHFSELLEWPPLVP
ncbi:HAD-IA family hydrolase [Microbulbifer sp. TYP-18]|uniref:HAD-IA family hydrolase n=1 Tax=Microbulbifer sp. TYP-18 TaxID=3230024 RepID=UPI0034C5DFAE